MARKVDVCVFLIYAAVKESFVASVGQHCSAGFISPMSLPNPAPVYGVGEDGLGKRHLAAQRISIPVGHLPCRQLKSSLFWRDPSSRMPLCSRRSSASSTSVQNDASVIKHDDGLLNYMHCFFRNITLGTCLARSAKQPLAAGFLQAPACDLSICSAPSCSQRQRIFDPELTQQANGKASSKSLKKRGAHDRAPPSLAAAELMSAQIELMGRTTPHAVLLR